MNTKDQNASVSILFSLLRGAITGEKLTEDERAAVAQADFAFLYALSKHHDLAHLLPNVLEQNAIEVPSEVSAALFKKQMLAVYRYERLHYAFEEMTNTLREEGIRHIPLKGSLIRAYYPEAWMRTSCDVDILVCEKDLQRAIDALVQKKGYKCGERAYHDVSLFSESGIHLELHFNIEENLESLDRVLRRVWDYTLPQGEDSVCLRQTPEFLVYHCVAHMAYHFVTGGCGIRPFMDLWLLKHRMGYDEAVVEKLCRESEIASFYLSAKKLSEVWFSGAEHDELSLQMQEYLLRGGVYGTVDNKITAQQQKKGGRVRYILSRIFLPYDALRRRYPVLEKHKWLMPICQVRRWFRMLFGGRLKRSLHELRVNGEVSREEQVGVADMMSRLGL